MSTDPQNKKQDADSYLDSAQQAVSLGRNDEARKAFEEARRLYLAEQNRMAAVHVLLRLGDLERMLGRNDEARKAFEQARRLYMSEQERLGEAEAVRALGELENKLGRTEQAGKTFDDARRLWEK